MILFARVSNEFNDSQRYSFAINPVHIVSIEDLPDDQTAITDSTGERWVTVAPFADVWQQVMDVFEADDG
jgi:hypothetical protein